jgi:hypothetical protein
VLFEISRAFFGNSRLTNLPGATQFLRLGRQLFARARRLTVQFQGRIASGRCRWHREVLRHRHDSMMIPVKRVYKPSTNVQSES